MSFHDLHHQDLPFVLPNAWDVPSALAYLADGFTAVGTTSFGVSSSCGHPDGGRATRDANIALAAALAPLQCYVSVDVEDGYSDDPDAVADYVAQLPVAGITSKTAPTKSSSIPLGRRPKLLLSNNATLRYSSMPVSTPIGSVRRPTPPPPSDGPFATWTRAPTASSCRWPTIGPSSRKSLATFRVPSTRCPCRA